MPSCLRHDPAVNESTEPQVRVTFWQSWIMLVMTRECSRRFLCHQEWWQLLTHDWCDISVPANPWPTCHRIWKRALPSSWLYKLINPINELRRKKFVRSVFTALYHDITSVRLWQKNIPPILLKKRPWEKGSLALFLDKFFYFHKPKPGLSLCSFEKFSPTDAVPIPVVSVPAQQKCFSNPLAPLAPQFPLSFQENLSLLSAFQTPSPTTHWAFFWGVNITWILTQKTMKDVKRLSYSPRNVMVDLCQYRVATIAVKVFEVASSLWCH